MDRKSLFALFTVPVIVLVLILILSKKDKPKVPVEIVNDIKSENIVVNKVIEQTQSTISVPLEKKIFKYTAVLKTTKGNITIALNSDQTPETVKNFVTLSNKNFYNGTIFHRVIKGFMIQGGDPNGDGTGGPGYKFEDEPFNGNYTRGTVAMANSGPNTNGSQFFIMHGDNDLPKLYVIFGKVTGGMDVVDAIATDQVEPSVSGEMSKPTMPTKIVSVQITESN